MPDPFLPFYSVLREIPNSSLSSLTVNRPLCAKLINRCFCSMGNSFFQGILTSLCVTHVLGHFVTDLLGSYPQKKSSRAITNLSNYSSRRSGTQTGLIFSITPRTTPRALTLGWLRSLDGRILELKTPQAPAWFKHAVLDKISPHP